jgi:hypothetical protein
VIDVEKYKAMELGMLNEKFVEACKNGDLGLVKYLLTGCDLKDLADIHARNEDGFHWACENGHLEVVRYLLTSPELKEHANINEDSNFGFRVACLTGWLNVVEYLLTSHELKEHVDIRVGGVEGLGLACVGDRLDIIRFLVFNMSIEKTGEVVKIIKDYPEVERMFEKRELIESLEWSLENKDRVKRVKL